MKKELSITKLSHVAWMHFNKEWISWVILAFGGVVLSTLSILAPLYISEYRYVLSFLLCMLIAIYTAILHKNGLDAVYGRKLNIIQLSPSILFAALFFIAISLYTPFPEYSGLLIAVLPENLQFLVIIDWVIHIVVSYVLVRCMFVGMILLEEKCNVIEAFHKSFKMTSHHIFLLLGFFLFLAVALALSAMTVVGYFVVLPYTILMKSLLFKHLNENLK